MRSGKKILALFLAAGMTIPSVRIEAEEFYSGNSPNTTEADVMQEVQSQSQQREVTVP